MSTNNFRQQVAIDQAPPRHSCEWCGHPAVYQMTALGGPNHNDTGLFCQACGEEFVHAVADTLDRVITADTPPLKAA